MNHKKIKKLARERCSHTGESYAVALAKLRARDHFRLWLESIARLSTVHLAKYRKACREAQGREPNRPVGILGNFLSPEAQRYGADATEAEYRAVLNTILEGTDDFLIGLAAVTWIGRWVAPEVTGAGPETIESIGYNVRHAADMLASDGRASLAEYLTQKPLGMWLPKGARAIAGAGVELHTLSESRAWGVGDQELEREARKALRLLADSRARVPAGSTPYEPTLASLYRLGYVFLDDSCWEITDRGAAVLSKHQPRAEPPKRVGVRRLVMG